MADHEVELNPGVGGKKMATETVAGKEHQLFAIEWGDLGSLVRVSGTNPLPVDDLAVVGGGLDCYSFISTAAVQQAAIKVSVGKVYGVAFFNLNASPRYVRLYNMATVPATTDAANILWRGMIPGNVDGGVLIKEFPKGLKCASGIGIRVTAGLADNDGTVLGANEVVGNVDFK